MRERENDTKASYFKSSSSIISDESVKWKLLSDHIRFTTKSFITKQDAFLKENVFPSNSHLVSQRKTKSVGMFEVKQYRKVKILLGYQTQKTFPKKTHHLYFKLKRCRNDRGVFFVLPVLTLSLVSFGKLTLSCITFQNGHTLKILQHDFNWSSFLQMSFHLTSGQINVLTRCDWWSGWLCHRGRSSGCDN